MVRTRSASPNMRHKIERITIPDDGRLRIVAVADTHGQPHPAARERIRALRPDSILHAGDMGELSVLDELERLAPTIAVRGNIDSRSTGLFDVITVELVSGDDVVLTVLLIHIGLFGVRLRGEVRRLAADRLAQLVVCGHSHIPWLGNDGKVTVFNPGALGPQRFGRPITIGLIDVRRDGVSLEHWDCVTGERWRPTPSP